MEKTVKLICPECNKTYIKSLRHHSEAQTKNRKLFCSRECSGSHSNKINELSPFRTHINRARATTKKKKKKDDKFDDLNLTLEYLMELWEKQEGKCPYTGWKLKNMKDTSRTSQLSKSPDRASLDRIDSSKGYVKGNVQFVSYMANCAKNEFTSAKLKHFCESMVKHCENMHWAEDALVG
jgi:hypothetical protein